MRGGRPSYLREHGQPRIGSCARARSGAIATPKRCAAPSAMRTTPIGLPWIRPQARDRKSTRLNSSHGYISYAVFCLKKKKKTYIHHQELTSTNMYHFEQSSNNEYNYKFMKRHQIHLHYGELLLLFKPSNVLTGLILY